MTKADTVTVEGISLATPNEAIVRAVIDGEASNLKLRRYDGGWVWEFAESKDGGWIGAEEALTGLREPRRLVAVDEWARPHRAAYLATAKDIHSLLRRGPNPKVGMDHAGWMRIRSLFADNGPDGSLMRNENPVDAWGTLLDAMFNTTENALLLASFGPDKIKSTADDLVGVVMSRPVIEQDGRLAYEGDISWILPEGLGDVVEKLTSPTPRGTIQFSRVVK